MSVADPPTRVRVARNGHSQTLTIPAKLAREAQIEPGDEFEVRVVNGGDLVYRRVGDERASFQVRGEGSDRHAVIAAGALVAVALDPAPVGGLDTWDF